MNDFGIDTESYEEKALLIFYQIPSPESYAKGVSMEFYQTMLKVFTEKSNNFFRMVGTWILNEASKGNIDSIIEIEQNFNKQFKNFNGHTLCSYSILGLDPKRRGSLIKQITQNHNAVIFTPSIDDGIAFQTENLGEISDKPITTEVCKKCGAAYPLEYDKCPNCNESRI